MIFVALLLLSAGEVVAQPNLEKGTVRVRLLNESDSAFVVWNDEWENARQIGPLGSFTRSPGSHLLRMIPARGRTSVMRISVEEGDTLTYGYQPQSDAMPLNMEYARLRFGADALLVVDPGAEIYAGDELLGRGSALLRAPSGGIYVRVTDGERERSVAIRPSPRRLSVESVSLYPSRQAALLGTAFPGMYQRAVGRWYGAPLAAATLAAAGWSAYAFDQAASDRSAFDDAERLYRETGGEQFFDERYAALRSAHTDASNSARTRTVALSVLGALVTAHILDLSLNPYRGRWRSALELAPLLDPSAPGFSVSTVIQLD